MEKLLKKFWEMDMLYEDLDLNHFFTENPDHISWTLDYNGITFYFNPYDIAPYASGMQVATIPFSAYPELVKEEYRQVPESYGMELSFEKPCYFDVDNDGALDEIVISATESETGVYESQSIAVNGIWFQDENVEAFSIDPVLVHTADGRNYIYIEDQGYSDYRMNHIYDVNGESPKKIGTVDGGLHYFISMEEEHEENTCFPAGPGDGPGPLRLRRFQRACRHPGPRCHGGSRCCGDRGSCGGACRCC